MKLTSIVVCVALSSCASRASIAPSANGVTTSQTLASAPVATPVSDASAPAPRCATEAPSPATISGTSNECPDDADVRVVHRWSRGEPSDACRAPEWIMHLALPDVGLERFFSPIESTEPQPRYRPMTPDEVREAAVSVPQGPVWVFTANDAAPCLATPGAVWVGAASAGGPTYAEIGVALHGCDMPGEGDYVYAFASAERPAACRYRAMSAPRTQGPAAPATVRARVPGRVCARPSCAFSWSHASVSIAGGAVDDVQALYTFPQRDVPECSYAHDWYHTVSWVPRAGAPWVRLESAGPVTGVLYDGRGIRTVITDELGLVRLFTTDGNSLGTSRQRSQTRWFIANEEDDWTIQPSCL